MSGRYEPPVGRCSNSIDLDIGLLECSDDILHQGVFNSFNIQWYVFLAELVVFAFIEPVIQCSENIYFDFEFQGRAIQHLEDFEIKVATNHGQEVRWYRRWEE